jgi:hypothetical protein
MRRPDLDASEVEVEVSGAEVTLSGTVNDRYTKRNLEDLCEDILGVDDVHNRIKVQRDRPGETGASHEPAFGSRRTGSETSSRPST